MFKLKDANSTETKQSFWQKFFTTEQAAAHLAALTQKDPNGSKDGITPLKQGDKNYYVIAQRLIREKLVPANTDPAKLAEDLRKWNNGHIDESTLSMGTIDKNGHLIDKNIYYKDPLYHSASPLNHQQRHPAGHSSDPNSMSIDKQMPTRKYLLDEIKLGGYGLDNFKPQTIPIWATNPNNSLDTSPYDASVEKEEMEDEFQNNAWNKYVQPKIDFLDTGGRSRTGRRPKKATRRKSNNEGKYRTPSKSSRNQSNTQQSTNNTNPLESNPQNQGGKTLPVDNKNTADLANGQVQPSTQNQTTTAISGGSTKQRETIDAISKNKNLLSPEDQAAFQQLLDKGIHSDKNKGKSRQQFEAELDVFYQKVKQQQTAQQNQGAKTTVQNNANPQISGQIKGIENIQKKVKDEEAKKHIDVLLDLHKNNLDELKKLSSTISTLNNVKDDAVKTKLLQRLNDAQQGKATLPTAEELKELTIIPKVKPKKEAPAPITKNPDHKPWDTEPNVKETGLKNTRIATKEERLVAEAKIKEFETQAAADGVKLGEKNLGYIEGKITRRNNSTGQNDEVNPETKIQTSVGKDELPDLQKAGFFNTKTVDKGNNEHSDNVKDVNAWKRTTDSEYLMLTRLVFEMQAKFPKFTFQQGQVYDDIVGDLKIISTNPYCISCQDVIKQFNTAFPNVNLVLIDNIKKTK